MRGAPYHVKMAKLVVWRVEKRIYVWGGVGEGALGRDVVFKA